MHIRSPQLFVVSIATLAGCGFADTGSDALTVSRAAGGGVSFVSGDLGPDRARVDELFGVAGSELTEMSSRDDDLGFHHQRFAQRRNGLPVVSGDLRITTTATGEVVAASGAGWLDDDVADRPSVSAADARKIALDSTVGGADATAAELVYVAPSTGEPLALAWRSLVSGVADSGLPIADEVFVDAATGALVDRHPRVHDARNRLTYDAAGSETNANLVRREADPAVGDLDVDRAHDAAGQTYDCLMQLFDRDSFDGLGGDLVSITHYGVSYQNAFWNGAQMVYGDHFAVLDVGTHEFGHAVTERTAALVYQNQSGALNEALSDILAAVCESRAGGPVSATAWMIGEEIPGIGPFRYMNDPSRDGVSSDHTGNLYTGTEDNGGVHLNSGVVNLAFVLLVEGGTHPRSLSPVEVTKVGVLPAAQIFHRALTSYLNANSDFVAARAATEQAAADLFGPGSSEAISVSEAWAAVGVGGQPPTRDEDPGQTEPDPDGDGDSDGDGGGASAGNLTGTCSAGGGNGNALWLLLALFALRRRSVSGNRRR